MNPSLRFVSPRLLSSLLLGLCLLGAGLRGLAQAPTITALSPPRNGLNAPTTTNVAITFSQPISSGAATLGSLRVFSQQRGGALRNGMGGSTTSSGNTLSFNPTTNFKPGETILTTVTRAAQSSSGVSLANGQVYQFTVGTGGPGRGNFTPPATNPNPPVGSNPYSVALGDVDGDGDLDFVTANYLDNTVSVRLNNGSGTFTPPTTNPNPAVGNSPVSVALGDVDGDGDLDLVTANFDTDNVSVRLNNGSGTFTPPATNPNPAVGDKPISVALGDVDGDGDLDLVTANYASNTVSVRLNNGSGTFTPPTTNPNPAVGNSPYSVALGDVDGDGDLDFVTANYSSNTVSVGLNDGSGTFTPPATNPNPPVGSNPISVALGDVDGDGDLDLLTANYSSNTVSVRLNNGSANFTPPATNPNPPVGPTPYSVAIGDVDGDGDLDFLAANISSANVSVGLNDGSGTFTPPATNPNPAVSSGPTSVALGDVDGDGDLDLLTANIGSDNVSVRLNQPAPPTITALSPPRNGLNAPTTANVAITFSQPISSGAATLGSLRVFSQQRGGALRNGMGGSTTSSGNTLSFNPTTNFKPGETILTTVTRAAQSSSGVSLANGQVYQFTVGTGGPGRGSFTAPATNPNPPVGTSPRSVAIGDVDGDGDLDLVTANSGSATVSVRLNDGSGTFTPPATNPNPAVGTAPFSVALGDVDGDGDLDLVTANYASNTVSVRLNNGSGSFTPPATNPNPAVGTAPYSVALGDVDGDGDLDLVTANYASATVSVRLNDGSANFIPPATNPNPAVGFAPYSVALGDVDGDGDLDLVTANYASNTVSVRLNDGSGTFTPPATNPNPAVGSLPSSVALGDVDGDGDLDLVTANYGSDNVSVRLNDGSGNFTPPATNPNPAVGSFPSSVALGDVDGDGDLDLLTANQNSDNVSVRLNDGSANFTPPATNPNPAVGDSPRSVALGDVDGDGDLDFLTANSASDNVSVRLNQPAPPTITALSPPRNGLNAPPTTNVAITFSQPISNGAATLGSLRVFSQQRGGALRNGMGGSTTSSGNTLSFNPTTNFKPGETILTTVTRAAQSSSGVSLANGQVYQFTVGTGGPGRGSFTPPATNPNPPVGDRPQSVAIGDVDGDGDLDLVTANRISNTVSVRLNDGSGTFTPPATNPNPPVGAAPISVALGDVDGDGDLDLLAANYSSNTVSVRLNDGSGTFTPPATNPNPAVGNSPVSVALGDVDGDGDLDLVTANNSSNTVSVRLNDGSANFTPPATNPNPPVGANPYSVALGDVDGDGDLDLVTANSGSATVSVRLNDGSANFTPPATNPNPAVGTAPFSVALGDMDGDGDLDLLTANFGDNTVSVRLNNGSANFTPPATNPNPAVGTAPESVALGDVDGDGDLDLVTANSGSATVSVRLNDGSANFTPPATNPNPAVGSIPESVALGDVDGDGDLDFLTANSASDNVSVRLNQPAPPTITGFAPTVNPVCVGSPLPFTATVGNLSPPYAFTLSSGTSSITGNATSPTFSQSLTASGSGPQSFTLTVNNGGPSATAITSVTVNALPTAGLVNNGPLSCSLTSVTLTASGGNMYRFSSGTNQVNNGPTATVTTAGVYSVTVISTNGCTATASTTVVGDVGVPTASLTNNGPISCSTTSVTLTASGGGSYRFSSGANQVNNGPTATVSSAGVYSVTVVGTNGCTATASTTVVGDQNVPAAGLTNNGPLSCSMTSVTLTASGGNTYRFSNGAAQIGSGPTAMVSTTGVYSVTVVGSNGCTATASTTVTGDQSVPTASLINNGPISCSITSVTLTASGGNTYRFSPGASQVNNGPTATVSTAGVYSVTVMSGNGCSATASTTVTGEQSVPMASLTNNGPISCSMTSVTLTASGSNTYRFSSGANQVNNGPTATVTTAGVYSVTVISTNGCTATASTTVVGDQSVPMANLTNNGPLSCSITSVTLTASGGNTYRFSNGANQVSNGSTATVSTAGVYSVTVASSNGCSSVASTTVVGDQSVPVAGLTNSGPISCSMTSVTLTASGGNTYRFGNGANQIGNGSTATVNSAGVYSVTVISGNGCTATASTTVTGDVSVPTAGLTNNGPISCLMTSVTLTASGGSSYRFSNGASQTGNGPTATVSSAGIYSVTVISGNGCSSVASTTVAGDVSVPVAGLTNNGPISCSMTSVTLTASGGSTYRFSSGAAQIGNGGSTATVSTAGVYSVTVMSGSGCSAVASTTVVGDQSVPTAGLTNNGPLSCSMTSVTLTASGGNTYRFSPGASQVNGGSTATVSTAGVYSVTVMSSSGCSAVASTTVVGDQSVPTAGLTNNGPLSCSMTSVTLTASGGNTYRFSTGASQVNGGSTATVSTAGVYSVTVIGTNGCSAVASTTVTGDQSVPTANLTNNGPLSCSMTSVTLTASGGSSYRFSNGANQISSGPTATISTAGVYSVTVVSSNGCSAVASTTVTADVSVPVVSIQANPSLTLTQGQTTTLTATASGSQPLTYTWSTLQTTPSISVSATGTYSVTVGSRNGCSATASVMVSVTVGPVVSGPFAITGITTVDCTPVLPNRFSLSFYPRYQGLNGQPVSFSVTNELFPTTQPGPYTLQLYSDNPTIILQAMQSGVSSSFVYNWLAACNSSTTPNTPPRLLSPIPSQTATVGSYFSYVIPDGTFTDEQTPGSLKLSAQGIPPGLSFMGATLSGTPSSTVGSPVSVTITATDPGSLSASTTLMLTVQPASGTPPPTAPFAITGVTTISCTPVANRINISFAPRYGGMSGQPIAFEVVNELATTTDPAPYSLTLYRDNPTITLRATQTGSPGPVSFRYDWLAACARVGQDNTPPRLNEPVRPQSATVGVAYSLNLINTFIDQETPDQITLSSSVLPAGLSLTGKLISGTPSMSGVSSVTLTATDGGGLSTSTSFTLTVQPGAATPPPNPAGPFSITGVTTVSCEVVSAGERRVTFTPRYGGDTGSPISFSVVSELAPTTNPGPYTLRLYTDNPAITLSAVQSEVSSRFSYGWLAACNGAARIATEPGAGLQVRVLGNPVRGDVVEIEVRGAEGQSLRASLVDERGQGVNSVDVPQAGVVEPLTLKMGQATGLYLLQVSTPTQQRILKLIKP